MAYTDTITTGTQVKLVHAKELKEQMETLATNASVSVSFTGWGTSKPTKVNMELLQNACNKLEDEFSYNCCQNDCCQTNQSNCKNQSVLNQTNQTCETAACESSTCQTNQKDQACQSYTNQGNCSSYNQSCQNNMSCGGCGGCGGM